MATPIAIHRLPRVFDRHRWDHPWLPAFAGLDGHVDLSRRVVGANWRMDHRVTREREMDMLAGPEFHGTPDAEGWWSQRRKHFLASLCRPASPPGGHGSAYALGSNTSNLIPSGTIPGHERLIHVACVETVLRRLCRAEYRTFDIEERFRDLTGEALPRRLPATAAPPAFKAQVDSAMDSLVRRGGAAVREFGGLITDALGDSQPPWWASFAAEVQHFLRNREWTLLCQALGLGHVDAGQRLLIWVYPIGDVGPVYRPTCVEAGDATFHFPSPPPSRYGIAMPLRKGMFAVREVVHAPLRGPVAIAACLPQVAAVVGAPIADHTEVIHLRKLQRKRLRREFRSPSTVGWIINHATLV